MLPGPRPRPARRGGCVRSAVRLACGGACVVLSVVLLRWLFADDDPCARQLVTSSAVVESDVKPAKLRAHRHAEFANFAQPEEPTLRELMALPSSFRMPPEGANVSLTVVLNHFKRKTLCAQIESLLAQTAVPAHIWLVLFGSPIAAQLEGVAQSYVDPRTSISVVESALNLKYYGRMQVAVRAPTDFVLIIDDDMIPGSRFVEQMMHAAHTRQYERALLGSIGWLLPRPAADGRFGSYRDLNGSGGVYFPDEAYGLLNERATEADYLCSLWFARTSWLAMIFHEKPPTFDTSEDLQLSLLLRKYAGVRSVVMPVDPADKETWADNAHRLAWLEASTTGPGAGKSKSGSNTPARDRAWWLGLGGGGSTRSVRERAAELRGQPLLLVTSLVDAAALRPIYTRLLARAGGRFAHRPIVALAAPDQLCAPLVDAIGAPPSACADDARALFALNFKLGDDALGGARRAADVLSEVMADLSGALGAFQPPFLLHALAPPTAGAAAGAALFGGARAAELDAGVALLLEPAARAAAVARAAALTCVATGVPLIALPIDQAADGAWLAALPLETLARWALPSLTVVVQGSSAERLERTLESVRALRLLGDRVPLQIRLAADAEPAAIAYAQRRFAWPHGPRLVLRPMSGTALEAARVAEAWYPSDEHALALLLNEGDVLSPHAYAWIKYLLLRYRYADAPSLAAATRGVLGIGLQPLPPTLRAEGAGAAVRDARIRADAVCLMPESWIEFYESVSAAIAKGKADALDAQAAGSSAWQSVLAAMTRQTSAAAAAAMGAPVEWQALLDRLAGGSRWTEPSALLRPSFADDDGVPLTFIETAAHAGYPMRLAMSIPFGKDEPSLPSVAELPRAQRATSVAAKRATTSDARDGRGRRAAGAG